MSIEFLTNRQGWLFLLLGCLLPAGCNKPVVHEPVPLAADKIYLSQWNDRHYPPEDVMRIINNQLEEKKPEGSDFNEINLPHNTYQQFTLKNGLSVDFLLRDNLPEINITVIINAGRDHVSASDELLSPLVLKLLKQGTQKYSRSAFQQAVSLLGEPIRYRQTSQYSVISINILPQDLKLALSLLAQQLAYIKAHKSAYRKISEQQLLENKLARSSGSYLAKLLFYQKNYPKEHPYYRHQPKSNELRNLSNAQLLDFYKTFYTPSQSRLIISGDIDAELLRHEVVENFSGWKAGLINQPHADVFTELENAFYLSNDKRLQFDFIEREGAQQIDLLYGVVTVPRRSSDWLSLNIIAALLGGGPSSRLFADLREQQGLTYSISAYQLSGRYQSPFFIQTSIAADKLIQTIKGINNHLEHLCRNKVGKQELANIKQQLSGEILFKLQTNQQLVKNRIYQLENNLSNDYLKLLSKEIRQINAQQLLAVANKYLCGKQTIIAVGELNSIENSIREKLQAYSFKVHHLPLH